MIGLALLVFSGLIFSFVFIKYIRPGGPYGIDKRKEPETLVASSVFADKIGDFKKVMDYKIDELKGYKFNIPVSMAIYEKEGKRIKVAVSIFKDEKESALAILGFKKQLEGQEYKISMRYGLGNWERQIFKEPFFPATILTWENVNTKEAGIMWNNRNYCFIVSDADAGTRDEFVQSFQH